MTDNQIVTALGTGTSLLIHLAFMARAILRPHREPASRLAWVVVMIGLPVAGILAYLLVGETSIGRRRAARLREVLARLPDVSATPGADAAPSSTGGPGSLRPPVPRRSFGQRLRTRGRQPGAADGGFQRRHRVDGRGHRRRPRTTSILTFYIWLPDNNGLKVVEALKRAAARKVTCRAMADGLGSRTLMASEHWNAMRDAGVHVATALPIGNLLLRPLRGRIDLRNHRKILVIDNRITYCGSQNCADPEFRDQGQVRPLGRCHDALRRPDRPAEPAPVPQRLDGPGERGRLRPCCGNRCRPANPG